MALIDEAQMIANKQVEWLEDNGMLVSPGKTKVLVCPNKELRRNILLGLPLGIQKNK